MKQRSTQLGTAALMAINSILLGSRLGSKSVWVDEVIGIRTARIRGVAAAFAQYKSSEVQPPLNDVLLYIWARIAGTTDAVVRVPSVVLAVACVPLVVVLARRLVGRRAGWIAAYLFAISPFVLLVGHMALYYVPTLFFTLCSALTLLTAFDRVATGGRSWPWWAMHTFAGALLLLTNYAAAAYVVAEAAFGALVVLGRVDLPGDRPTGSLRAALPRWTVSTASLVVLFAGWFAADASRLTTQPFTHPRPAELLGVVRLVLDTAYPLYAWTVGPTIFPWHAVGALAAITAAAILIAGSAIALRSRRYVLVAAGSLGVLAITVLAYQVYVKGRPFETVPTRAISAFPFVLMLVALPIDRLGRGAAVAVLVVFTVAYAVGASNYFRNRDFHNSIYAVPSRMIARTIMRDARAGDVVVAEDDSEVPYYLSATAGSPCTIRIRFRRPTDAAALAAVRAHPPSRVWVVSLGRDGTEGRFPSQTKQWIEDNYRLANARGFVRQDRRYTAIKRKLQGGPGYEYKATLRLFDHPDGHSESVSCSVLQS